MRKRLELPEDAVLFVFVGRITEDKGIRELLAAFSALRAETGRPPVFLALVGWTEDYAGDKLDVPGVFRPGFQEDIRSWLEAADAFVLPATGRDFPIRCCRRVPWNCPPLPRIYAGAMRS